MSLFVVTFFALLANGGSGTQSTNSAWFVQEEMCNLQESIHRGCSKVVSGTRGPLECTILCWHDTECVGASLDARGMCLHHQLCHLSVPCLEARDTKRHLYLFPNCLHGTWNSTSNSCECHHETFGERCDKYLKSCDNLKVGVHWVILDPLENGKDLITVRCSVKGRQPPFYSHVQIVHNSGGFNANRSWEEYENGFMIDEKNYWAGLRSWHILGKAGLTHLYIVLRFRNSRAKVLVHYDYFLVSGKDDNYTFASSFNNSRCILCEESFLENTADCLSPLQGIPFSTWDRDQGESSRRGENCASTAGSGWWYNKSCDNPCQLLGWGLANYDTTHPAQRLTFLGINLTSVLKKIKEIKLQLWREMK